jgi:hypothetical protein
MVGSEHLARLIAHAEGAGAKLVLIGDPAQLDAIEAGGLFAAIAERTDPVVLDEVIRHNHALDREAAKRIREGEGAEALSLYRSAERVTVAPGSESRREAMVGDWFASYREGDDALMVAQRNAEVERLNAAARELLRTEGMLGEQAVEVGRRPLCRRRPRHHPRKRPPPATPRLHRQGAGRASFRSRQGVDVGAGCEGHRELPPGTRHHGHPESPWEGAAGQLAAHSTRGRAAKGARSSAQAWPGAPARSVEGDRQGHRAWWRWLRDRHVSVPDPRD